MTLLELPTYHHFIDQRFVIEPLGGPKHPRFYTDRFPDEVYHKAPESHLTRFLYTLLGPAGVGWLRKQTFDARLMLEAQGLELFDLDRFYGDPFAFGRILEEMYDEDPRGVLPADQWATIRAKDQKYRSRALDFFNAARAGNTPLGMKYAARSGLGHEVEIIENYKHLFDVHSDDPVGVVNYGTSTSLTEMIVLPRLESSRSEEQTITITGTPSGGSFLLTFDGQTTSPIAYDATALDMQDQLRALSNIGPYGVEVRGGDGPLNPWVVKFRGHLGSRNVPQLTVHNALTGGTNPQIIIETTVGGHESTDEVVHIPAREKYNLQQALDRLKPITTIPTTSIAPGLQQRHHWRSAFATSEYDVVLRFVTGKAGVLWPAVDHVNWVERGVEKEAPRVAGDLQYHYVAFHDHLTAHSYTDNALEDDAYDTNLNALGSYTSEHIGRFNASQRNLPGFDYLRHNDDTLRFTADRVFADYAEPLTVTSQTGTGVAMINGIYPINYLELEEIQEVQYKDEQFWSSLERSEGDEYLEIDLGQTEGINFLTMEVARKPLSIEIAYDALDQSPRRHFVPVAPLGHDPSSVAYEPESRSPWVTLNYFFEDGKMHQLVWTRYLRIRFSRQDDSRFLSEPWSVDVRNLRVGRNTSNL